MAQRRPYLLIGVTVFMVGLAMRVFPLYWSYLPFNLDGFQFAAPARYALHHGYLPMGTSYFDPDKYTFSALLTMASQMTGFSPLRIAQPLIAIVGTVPCLVAVLLGQRIARQHDWELSHRRLVSAVAGLVLAIEGVYLGRSAAVTSEGAGLVLVTLLAIVFFQALQTKRRAWVVLSVIFIAVLPLTHILATIEGAIVLTALLALSVHRMSWDVRLFGVLAVVGFWIYLVSYYSVLEMERLSSRITGAPGLFVAWLLMLVVFLRWLPTTNTRNQRLVPFAAILGGCLLVVGNHFVSIFPGTASTQTLAVFLTAPVVVIGVVATWGLPFASRLNSAGEIVAALLFSPLTLVAFALTAGLTFEYQGIATRSQIFLHLAAVVLSALAAVALSRRVSTRRLSGLRWGVVPLLIVCAIVSAPLAFAGLHATPAQPVTSPAELNAATFATDHVNGQWASDGKLSRLAGYYYPTRANASSLPVYQWLVGSEKPPRCPVVSQASWMTVGAQLFPAAPKRIESTQYTSWTAQRQIVYSTGSPDTIIISLPASRTNKACHR